MAVQGYLASISYCDWIVGQVIEALNRSGLRDSTIIVLWGDNGFHLGEKLHWRKFVLWEEATRVPLIIVPPYKMAARNRVYDPVGIIDIFPTLWSLCGLDDAPIVDGESLAALMCEEDMRRTTPVISTWGRGNHSVRFAHWRFTCYNDGSEELYDLRADPFEWTNLAGNPGFQALRQQLRTAIPVECTSVLTSPRVSPGLRVS